MQNNAPCHTEVADFLKMRSHLATGGKRDLSLVKHAHKTYYTRLPGVGVIIHMKMKHLSATVI